MLIYPDEIGFAEKMFEHMRLMAKAMTAISPTHRIGPGKRSTLGPGRAQFVRHDVGAFMEPCELRSAEGPRPGETYRFARRMQAKLAYRAAQ